MKELPVLFLGSEVGDRGNKSYWDRTVWVTQLLVQRSIKFILKRGKTILCILIWESWLFPHFLAFSSVLEIYLGQSFGFDLPLSQETENIV